MLVSFLLGSGEFDEDRKRASERERRSRAGKVRTVLTEKQLNILKTCYRYWLLKTYFKSVNWNYLTSANPRPDALMKEQLTEMTGLSARVVRVWFQNKRCKEKKKLREATKVSIYSFFPLPLCQYSMDFSFWPSSDSKIHSIFYIIGAVFPNIGIIYHLYSQQIEGKMFHFGCFLVDV